jgi:arylsulfatase A-like enzyme
MRPILSVVALLTLAGRMACADEPNAQPPPTEGVRPNVLFIAVDDLNDWVGCLGGHPQVKTPNFDRLAARGVLFSRAYCAAPSCNPSRGALLTGIRPSTSGVYVNDQKFRRSLPDAVTMPQYFTANGYRVAGGGKIFHHGDTDPQSWPEYFNQPKDPLPSPLVTGPISDHFTWQPLDVPDEAMGDYKVVQWASQWLAENASRGDVQPFYLGVGFYRPHMPLHVPRKYFDAHPLDSIQLPEINENDLDDVPAIGRWLAANRGYHEKIVAAGQWCDAVQGYLAAVEFFDAMLGRLIDAFDRSQCRDNTVIVLWSDHGWHHGQKDHWSKFALWEQTTRSPMLVVAPGVTKPQGRCDASVSLLDIYPTLVELCGLPAKKELEGQSLVPLLRDPDAARQQPAVMTFGPNSHAVRQGQWRYIRYCDGGEELYDHQTDPLEWTNLGGRPEFAQIQQSLARWLPTVNRPLEKQSVWLPPGYGGKPDSDSEPTASSGEASRDRPQVATWPGIVVDDEAAELTGQWVESAKLSALVGSGYRHDGAADRGGKSARFTPDLPAEGRYEVRLLYQASPNRASNVQVTIRSADGETAFTIDQRQPAFIRGVPRELGVCRFEAGTKGSVVVSNAGADGFVVIDGVQFVPQDVAEAERAAASQARTAPALVMPIPSAEPDAVDGKHFDLVVVEGTPGGIAMAVRAAREDLSVLLVNHNRHLGGILSSGLRVWDTLYEGKRSPIYDEVRQAVFDYYLAAYGEGSKEYLRALPGKSGHTNGQFEPHVIEGLFNGLVAREPRITVLGGFVPVKVDREGRLIRSLTLGEFDGEKTVRVEASVFADCSYEGDMMALAKVPYRVGRESRSEYNEPHAGKIYMRPTATPTAAAQEIVALHDSLNLRVFHGWQEIAEESTGEADDRVQAFNYRTILSADPQNQVPVTRPDDYDPERLKRLENGNVVEIPNDKFGWNRPQLVGPHLAYVEGDWKTRQEVMDAHWNATMGILYFLKHDPSAAQENRPLWDRVGLAKDEFVDNAHRPYEIYVREARRLVGRYVFTEYDATLAAGLPHAPIHADGIAVTEWYLDTHACTFERVQGSLDEGKMMLHSLTFPGQAPYRCLLSEEIDNLLVPVCLSSTHVAWGTIRLEPTWMNVAESAAYAAAMAVKRDQTPAEVDPGELLRMLAERRVMISFFNDVDLGSEQPWVPAVEYLGTKGFFRNYDARPDEPLSPGVARCWANTFAKLARRGLLDATAEARNLPAEESGGNWLTVAEFTSMLQSALPGGADQTMVLEACGRLSLKPDATMCRSDACRLVYELICAETR